ncbi:MAG: glycosyltransferase family 4 protein [Pseudomonadota bacterium]
MSTAAPWISQIRWRAKIALKRPPLAVYPWIAANPYQHLLYRRFDGRVRPERLHTLDELRMFGTYSGRRRGVLHLHWEQAYAWGEPPAALLNQRFTRLKCELARWKARGGPLVWTLHDPSALLPGEETRLPEMRRHVGALADLIHVHSAEARRFAEERLDLPRDRIAVIEHPSYLPLYPPALERSGPGASGARLLCFGAIKPYKNFDELGRALDTLPEGSFASLRVCGAVSSGGTPPAGPIRSVGALKLDLRWIGEEEVPAIFAAADFLVLPYRETLTSGAALLAMGFGVPIIAPDIGSMRASAPPENAPLLYDPARESGLADALCAARDMSSHDYARLSTACRALAEARHPDFISQRLLATLQDRVQL